MIRAEALRVSFASRSNGADTLDLGDLTLAAGARACVVGGSGTGKSVLMRSIIGLQQPDEGQIEVFGQSMTDAEPDEALGVRNRWGVLFQGGALFSTLTVGENVEVPLKQFYPEISDTLRREIARYKIMLSGLPEEAVTKYPSELSGGMKKRAWKSSVCCVARQYPTCLGLRSLCFLGERGLAASAGRSFGPYRYSNGCAHGRIQSLAVPSRFALHW